MALLPAIKATLDRIRMKSNNYTYLTDIPGIPRHETKDLEGTIGSIFGINIDTNLFTTHFLLNKLYEIYELASTTRNTKRIILFEAQTLTGFPLFCAKVMHLG